MDPVARPRAVLDLGKKNIPHLQSRGWAIYNGIVSAPEMFLDPVVPLDDLKGQLKALDDAQQQVGRRTKGAAQVRDLAARTLVSTLELVRAWVQRLADASPELAAIIIAKAAMTIAKDALHAKPLVDVKPGKTSTSVSLVANVTALAGKTSKRIYFRWQMSDNGGESWITLDATPLGNTEVHDLTPLKTYLFRASVTHSDGTTLPWSQATSYLVV